MVPLLTAWSKLVRRQQPGGRRGWVHRWAGLVRLAVAVCVLVLALPVANAAAIKGHATKQAHAGPFGLKWGKSAADARSVLKGKVTFVKEEAAPDAPYHTVDQHYVGNFGGMPALSIFLRFHRGEFFYMSVQLQAGSVPGDTVRAWDQAVGKMREAYGEPLRLTVPPPLASAQAVLDNVQLPAARDAVLPILAGEHQAQRDVYPLRELQVHTGMWLPFAVWHFTNKVLVQAFMWRRPGAAEMSNTVTPYWIFVHEERFAAWKKVVKTSKLVEPRDY